MKEQLLKLRESLSRVWRTSLGRLFTYVKRLSPGDRVIAYTLGALFTLSTLAGVYAIEKTFLVEVPSVGGSLSEGIVGSPRFVNPLLALSDADRDLVMLTYAGLMGRTGAGELVPVLAESYEVGDDGKTYTFVIREDAQFSDGTSVTAEDVVFTVQKAQDPGLKSPRLADWAGVGVESIDARTVRFTLPKSYGFFLEDTTLGILPADAWRDVSNEEFPFSPLMARPIGAGPFEVENVSRDKSGVIERYELKAFTGYALGRAYLDSLRFEFFAQEEDLARALEDGRIESAHGVPSEGALRAPYSRVFGVFFNQNQNPLFARLEVRKALSVAVDRPELTDGILGGYATPVWGPVPPGRGISSTAPAQEEADEIAEAARILEEEGWEYDGEARLWKHEDENLQLQVTIKTSNVPELKALAEEVRADWALLGVPVSIEFYEPGDLAQNVIRPRRYEALLFGMVVGRDRDLFAFWHSSERNDPGLNVAMYTNSAVDDLLESVREEADPTEIEGDLKRINDLIAEDYPAVFTHVPDFLYTVPENLHGLSLAQVAAPSDRFLDAARWYRRTEFVWPFLVHGRDVVSNP